MRSLQEIIKDPMNNNTPEFIAERFGLSPVLVRTREDIESLAIGKLPVLGDYVPEGWKAGNAACMVDRHIADIHCGNDLAMSSMAAGIAHILQMRNIEVGLAVDVKTPQWVGVRTYLRMVED